MLYDTNLKFLVSFSGPAAKPPRPNSGYIYRPIHRPTYIYIHWRRLVKTQKYWVGKPKYCGDKEVVKSDKCMGDSQLLGSRARSAPTVYAYIYIYLFIYYIYIYI